jgi:hypothetical protein
VYLGSKYLPITVLRILNLYNPLFLAKFPLGMGCSFLFNRIAREELKEHE